MYLANVRWGGTCTSPPTYVGGQRTHVRWGGGAYVAAPTSPRQVGGGAYVGLKRRNVNVVTSPPPTFRASRLAGRARTSVSSRPAPPRDEPLWALRRAVFPHRAVTAL